MKNRSMKTKLSVAVLLGVMGYSTFAQANQPYCSGGVNRPAYQVIAYLGSDMAWQLSPAQKAKLKTQLQNIDVLNYAFVRFKQDDNGNTVLDLSSNDVKMIKALREIRPDLPIILSVGGWGGRGAFKPILDNPQARRVFVNSVFDALQKYQLDGIDIDWENEQLATRQDKRGLVGLFDALSARAKPQGYCVTNAVPATAAYWYNYPNASRWKDDVNWTTIMAYDHYGTVGPTTDFGASLYASDRSEINTPNYPYKTTSGNKAIKHYRRQGLPAKKEILGVPFYCHSYYVDNKNVNLNARYPGLHVPVLDPNISSQVTYSDAYAMYGEQLFQYRQVLGPKNNKASTFYGLIPISGTPVSRFMSCDSPQSMADKVRYVKSGPKLGGVSFWELSQDLPYSNSKSLLRAISENLRNK